MTSFLQTAIFIPEEPVKVASIADAGHFIGSMNITVLEIDI